MVVRFRKAKPGEYRHGPEDDEGVPYPVLGVTAYFPGFDSRRFLQRNRRRIFLVFLVIVDFVLLRAAPIRIARLLEQRTAWPELSLSLVPIENPSRIHCYLLCYRVRGEQTVAQ